MPKPLKLDIISTPSRHILDLRKLGFRDVLILGKYNYTFVRPPLRPNVLTNMLQVCFCGKGRQVYEIGGRQYTIKGGEVLVTFPGERHGTGNYPEDKGVMYWMIIQLGGKNTGGAFLGASGAEANKWKHQLLNIPRRHFKGDGTMKIILENIFRMYEQKKDPMRNIALTHLLGSYLLEVITCSKKAGKASQSERWLKLKQFIRGNIHEPLTIGQLAAVAGLSPSRFKVWFKEETGTTPIDYALRQKIEHAEALLREGSLSIKEIALETGFQTPQYFATVFKKYHSISPTMYRMQFSDQALH